MTKKELFFEMIEAEGCKVDISLGMGCKCAYILKPNENGCRRLTIIGKDYKDLIVKFVEGKINGYI